jgi:hypothetical protein
MFGVPAERGRIVPAPDTFITVRFDDEDLQSGFPLEHGGKTFCGLHTLQGLFFQNNLGHDKNTSEFFFISV